MATYSGLRTSIDNSFPTNNNELITASILRDYLNQEIDQLGQLQVRGVASVGGSPGTINGPAAWFASEEGIYSNFGSESVGPNEIKYIINDGDGGWSSETIVNLDSFGFINAVADTDSVLLTVVDNELTADVNLATITGNDLSIVPLVGGGLFLDVSASPVTDTNDILGGGAVDVDLQDLLDEITGNPSSLWSENGPDIYRLSNVGFGIATPEASIHTNANQLFENNSEVRWKDSGGVQRTIFELTPSDDFYIGGSYAGSTIFVGGGSYTERMRIAQDGRIGINTTTPGSSLHVNDGDIHLTRNGLSPKILIGDVITAGNYGGIKWDSANDNTVLFTEAGGDTLSVKEGGNVQFNNYGSNLNTGTPVNYPAFDASGNIIERTFAEVLSDIGGGSGSSLWSEDGPDIFRNSNVGINVSDPLYALDVSGFSRISGAQSSGLNPLMMLDSTSTRSGLAFYNTTSGNTIDTDGARIFLTNNILRIENREADEIQFYVNGAQRMFIDELGNVGINQTSPSAKFSMTGDARFNNLTIAPAGNDSYFQQVSAGDMWFRNIVNDENINFVVRNTTNGYNTTMQLRGGNEDIRMVTGGVESLLLQTSGELRLTNYGSGTFSGTPVNYIAVDVNGDLIERSFAEVLSDIGGGGSSLWFENANGIHYTSGNVGIGDALPDAQLHVNGDAIFEVTSSSSRYIYFGDYGSPITSNQALNVYVNSSGTETKFQNYSTSGRIMMSVGSLDQTKFEFRGRGYATLPGLIQFSADTPSADTEIGNIIFTASSARSDSVTYIDGADVVLNGGGKNVSAGGLDGNVLLANDRGFVGVGLDLPLGKLHVSGDSSGSSTFPLIVENSSGDYVIAAKDNGTFAIDGTFNTYATLAIGQSQTDNSTSVGLQEILMNRTFAPITGSAEFVGFDFAATINQTGTASGTTSAIQIAPVLTSAADWKAIFINTSSGFAFYQQGTSLNYFEGAIGLGTETPDEQLHIHEDSGGQVGIKISNNDTGQDSNDGAFIGYSNTEVLNFNNRNNSDIWVSTNNLIRMAIQSDGKIGIGTTSPNASALLDLTSTTALLLIPRMSTTARNAISSPADGGILYNTTDNKFQGRANGAWVDFH